jgi:hypothetical protein
MKAQTPEQAIKDVFDRYTAILDKAYVGGDLSKKEMFTFDVDGLEDTLQFVGNTYAAWCANLEGALRMDWGWGWFEIVDSVRDRGFFVEHNQLNYLAETFQFLNDTFGTATPDVPEHTPDSPLHQLITEQLLGESWYELDRDKLDYKFSMEEFITQYTDHAAPYVDKLIAQIEGK